MSADPTGRIPALLAAAHPHHRSGRFTEAESLYRQVLAIQPNNVDGRTSSAAEVRQPIYKSSVGRWRPDEALLRPLLDALAAAGE